MVSIAQTLNVNTLTTGTCRMHVPHASESGWGAGHLLNPYICQGKAVGMRTVRTFNCFSEFRGLSVNMCVRWFCRNLDFYNYCSELSQHWSSSPSCLCLLVSLSLLSLLPLSPVLPPLPFSLSLIPPSLSVSPSLHRSSLPCLAPLSLSLPSIYSVSPLSALSLST